MGMRNILEWLESTRKMTLEEEAAIKQYIDPKRIDLVSEYSKMNRKLFKGNLGIYPMKWNRRKRSGGLVKFERFKEAGKPVQFKVLSVEISANKAITKKIFLDTLAHEMIHVYWLEQGVEDHHRGPFKSEMNRINSLGFNVCTSRDLKSGIASGDIALKSSGREYAVFVRETPRGSFMSVVPRKRGKEYANWLFDKFLSRGMNRHLVFDVYIYSSAWLDSAKITRPNTRRLAAYLIASDELQDLLKNGRKVMRLKSMGDAEYKGMINNVKF